eukprot:gene883-964_t
MLFRLCRRLGFTPARAGSRRFLACIFQNSIRPQRLTSRPSTHHVGIERPNGSFSNGALPRQESKKKEFSLKARIHQRRAGTRLLGLHAQSSVDLWRTPQGPQLLSTPRIHVQKDARHFHLSLNDDSDTGWFIRMVKTRMLWTDADSIPSVCQEVEAA